ncbi:DoxX family protein [Actinoplanes sp. NPDC051861]|uniref:DoxX family protein n=1 Tax=Actinoplanes sp. NPDC051861 TaxID=3155170 RepID=UPI00341A5991
MFIATLILSVLFAALLVVSAAGKLRGEASQVATLERVGARKLAPVLALLELAGAAGLVAGLAWWPIGIAAGTGIALYFLGAIGAHLRVKDTAVTPAAVLLVVSLAAVTMRALTA